MEDLDSALVLANAVEDPDRRMHEAPNARMISDGSAHSWAACEEIEWLRRALMNRSVVPNETPTTSL
jgi:hypothetical protein